MLKRKIKVTFRLDEKEFAHLKKQVERCGYSQERYIRSILRGYIPREMPPIDFHNMVNELHAIGNNLNQIAARVNAMGWLCAEEYKDNFKRLMEKVLEIQKVMLLPEKIDKKNMRVNGGAEE